MRGYWRSPPVARRHAGVGRRNACRARDFIRRTGWQRERFPRRGDVMPKGW